MRAVLAGSSSRSGSRPDINILHVITGLNVGGAETMLTKVVGHPLNRHEGLAHSVLSLLPPGPLAESLRAAGVPILSLSMHRGLPGPTSAGRLLSLVRRLNPSVIQGWMYHGNLAAALAQRVSARNAALLWNIRHSIADISREPARSRMIMKVGARFSRSAASIIYNSNAAARQHAAIGYADDRQIVIPNGFDCERFKPAPDSGRQLRSRFNIRNRATIVAMVARAHPMKTVDVLVRAVAGARSLGHDLHLLLVGNGMDQPSPTVTAALAGLPSNRVTLVGERNDVAEWLPGVDILALSSSWGEGFPNILGEAMACGVPCVTTNVGDSGAVVDRAGIVVPAGDIQQFAAALVRLDSLGVEGRRMFGRAGRLRVQRHYSLDAIVESYIDLWMETAGRPRSIPGLAPEPRLVAAP